MSSIALQSSEFHVPTVYYLHEHIGRVSVTFMVYDLALRQVN